MLVTDNILQTRTVVPSAKMLAQAFEKCMQCTLEYKEHSTYRRVGIQRLEKLLHCGRDRRHRANVHYLSLQRKVLSLRNKVDTADELVIAIRTGKTQWVATPSDQHLLRGQSLKYSVSLLEGTQKCPQNGGKFFDPPSPTPDPSGPPGPCCGGWC